MALHLEIAAGGPEIAVVAAIGAEALQGPLIDPVALEIEEGDQSLEIFKGSVEWHGGAGMLTMRRLWLERFVKWQVSSR
jgi:hypothetical protein